MGIGQQDLFEPKSEGDEWWDNHEIHRRSWRDPGAGRWGCVECEADRAAFGKRVAEIGWEAAYDEWFEKWTPETKHV